VAKKKPSTRAAVKNAGGILSGISRRNSIDAMEMAAVKPKPKPKAKPKPKKY
jgi:hypothetical protein